MLRLAIVFFLVACPATAQVVDALRQFEILSRPGRGTLVIGPAGQSEWAAVGRVNKGELDPRGTCTGVLVAPDLVLTAAHCVWITGNPELRPAELASHFFVAGWNRGSYVALSAAADAYKHPDAGRSEQGYKWHRDFAFIRLADPIEDVVPLRFGPPPVAGEQLAFFGYTNAHRHAPVLHAPCEVEQAQGNLAIIACSPHGGNSGSPVLRATEDGWEIVGTMVARTGQSGLLAVPDAWVLSEIAGDPTAQLTEPPTEP